jgi:glucosyl-3-phosphoglycerate phosphatase
MSRPEADVPAHRRLVLLRHGQTAWNAERRAQGHSDVPLDHVGRAQAAAAAPYVAGLRPRFVWSSDLARARETGELVAAAAGVDLRLDERLREYHLGERTGITMDEYAAAHPKEYRLYRSGRYDVVPGGETTEQVVERVGECLRDALAALDAGGCGVLVGHGAALKVSLLAVLGWPEGLTEGLEALHNCCWAELRDSGLDGRLRLGAYNRRAVGGPDFVSP